MYIFLNKFLAIKKFIIVFEIFFKYNKDNIDKNF